MAGHRERHLRWTVFILLALPAATKVAAGQSAPVHIKFGVPANAVVRAFAPDSGRFALGADQPVSRRDTLELKDGAVLSYDGASGALRILVSGVRPDQSVDIRATGERKSRWTVFTGHDVSVGARGPMYGSPPRMTASAAPER